MSFLFTILIVVLLVRLLRWGLFKYLNYRVNKMFGNAFGGSRSAGSSSSSDRGSTRSSGRKKVFDRTDGEYVEFEEIRETVTTTSSDDTGVGNFDREEQVTDAEWVDIK